MKKSIITLILFLILIYPLIIFSSPNRNIIDWIIYILACFALSDLCDNIYDYIKKD